MDSKADANTGELLPEPEEIVVSVVIPCLNEAEGVGICVEKAHKAIREMGVAGEVVVVDNGSDDGSDEIARQAGARVIHERRRGYGSAYLRGFREAHGRYMVMGDADDTYDFLDIPRFIEPLMNEGYDMVMGTRIKGDILPGAMSWSHRWIGNPILSGMLKLLFRTSVSDSHCGMRSFTREAYKKMRLHTTGMEFASEVVVNALREHLEICEIPITYHPREGESKLEGISDAWRHVRFMLLYSPSHLFQLPGFILCGVGGLLVAALAGGPVEFFHREWDYHALLFGALALILGHNLIIYDLIAKTFAIRERFIRENTYLRSILRAFSLERGLAMGGILFLAGLGIEAKIALDWLHTGGGALMAVRGVTVGMLAMVLGAQTAFGSFLMSLLLIERR